MPLQMIVSRLLWIQALSEPLGTNCSENEFENVNKMVILPRPESVTVEGPLNTLQA